MPKIYLTKAIVKFNNKFLFLRKVKDILPENNGKWECPGGKIDKNEEPEKVVLREVKEETGLKCEIVKELPLLHDIRKGYDSTCHVFLLKSHSDKVRLSLEHSEYKWLKAEEVKNIPLVLFADLLLKYFNNSKTYLD